MRVLFDTHAFLWFIGGSPNLSSHARQLIEDVRNERLISIASLWEMSIKASIGTAHRAKFGGKHACSDPG